MNQNETVRQNDLASASLGTLMRRYCVPCVISLLVGALYNIVDQIFIANASYLGSYGNAANTVVFPLTVVTLAIAVMIGDGCCAYVSIRLGSGKPAEAGLSVGNSVALALFSGVLLGALYLVFRDPLVTLFGGRVNAETFRHAQTYFFWISLGIPFYMFGQAMNPVIRADGSPRFAMASTLAGAAANIVLDPIFIFVFRWGMMGASVATVLGQILTAALTVWYLFHLKSVKLSAADFRPDFPVIGRTLVLGLCSFLSQISLVAAMAAINNMIAKYSALDPVFGEEAYAQIPMAVVGIVMKFFQIIISIVVGMAAGCIPVVAAGPREIAVFAAPALRGGGGTHRAFDRRILPGRAHPHLRRGERERVLHRIRPEVLPRLPLDGGAGLRQQDSVHLPAGDGEGGGVHGPLDDPRDRFRRGLRAPASALLRARRRALFDARLGRPHRRRVGRCHHPRAPRAGPCGGRERAHMKKSGEERIFCENNACAVMGGCAIIMQIQHFGGIS